MIINQLKEPVSIKFDQYECRICSKKSYINSEDKQKEFVNCLLCSGEAKNVRVFEIDIKGIGEY